MKYKFLFIIFLVILLLSGFAAIVYMHESVHQAIYKSYGLNSHLGLNFKEAYAQVDEGQNYSLCNSTCTFANNLNEIITYPLQVIYVFIGLLIIIDIYIRIEAIDLNTRRAYKRGRLK